MDLVAQQWQKYIQWKWFLCYPEDRLHNKGTAAEKMLAGCRSVNAGPFRFSQGPLKVKELRPSATGRTRAVLQSWRLVACTRG